MILWSVVLTQTVLILGLALAFYLRQRRGQQQLKLLEKQLLTLTSKTEQNSLLSHEIKELRSGIIGVGQRVLNFESALTEQQQLLQHLTDKQQSLALADPEAKIYSRAVKMVELGADLEEIIQECELPRAEAELLLRLHRTKSD